METTYTQIEGTRVQEVIPETTQIVPQVINIVDVSELIQKRDAIQARCDQECARLQTLIMTTQGKARIELKPITDRISAILAQVPNMEVA